MLVRQFSRVSVAVILAMALLFGIVPVALADNDGSSVSIGVDWIGIYDGTGSPGDAYGNLNAAEACAESIYNIVSDGSTSWIWQYNWGNSAAWELDWKKPSTGGNAYRLADDVDLAVFCGHGLANAMQFSVNKNDWSSTPSEQDQGLRDCEWMLTYTCNYLNGTMDKFAAAANGVHLICGYATDMTVTSNGGKLFGDYARPSGTRQAYGVRVAWYKYGQASQIAANANIARTFGAKSAVNDYLWGYGAVSADPAAYSSATAANYTYWDTRLNW